MSFHVHVAISATGSDACLRISLPLRVARIFRAFCALNLGGWGVSLGLRSNRSWYHAGTTLSIFAVERQNLIRVSLVIPSVLFDGEGPEKGPFDEFALRFLGLKNDLGSQRSKNFFFLSAQRNEK
jgi:hypothetical protein